MKATLLGSHEPNTPGWDALRARGIGGSEVAAIVGLSPWESRFSLFHRKRGRIGKQAVNRGMDWGTRLEPIICDRFAESRDMLDVIAGGTYAHHERPWQLGNPDRLLWDDEHGHVGLLEAKTASAFDAHEWGKSGTAEIPPYYRCQVLWYLDVLELPTAHLAVLIGGSDYREYEIAYAADEAEWLRDQAETFWAEVIDGTDPPIDGHDATYRAVREMHPDINGDTVQIDPDLHEWFQSSKTAADLAAAQHKAAKATLLDAMGQAQYAAIGEQVAYRRQPHGRGGVALYSVPPFRADNTPTEESA